MGAKSATGRKAGRSKGRDKDQRLADHSPQFDAHRRRAGGATTACCTGKSRRRSACYSLPLPPELDPKGDQDGAGAGAAGAGAGAAGFGAAFFRSAAFFGAAFAADFFDFFAPAFFALLFFTEDFFFFRAGAAFLLLFAFLVFALDFRFFAIINLPMVLANPNTHTDTAANLACSAGGTLPPVAQSISSTGWTTGITVPAAICVMQPTLPAAITSGFIFSIFPTLRSRNLFAMSGCRML
jgi:hypothetical protein